MFLYYTIAIILAISIVSSRSLHRHHRPAYHHQHPQHHHLHRQQLSTYDNGVSSASRAFFFRPGDPVRSITKRHAIQFHRENTPAAMSVDWLFDFADSEGAPYNIGSNSDSVVVLHKTEDVEQNDSSATENNGQIETPSIATKER